MASGLPGAGDPVAGVGPLETVGEELAVVGGNIGTGTLVATGALVDGVHPNVEVFITASFAAISARFCAMRSVLDSPAVGVESSALLSLLSFLLLEVSPFPSRGLFLSLIAYV